MTPLEAHAWMMDEIFKNVSGVELNPREDMARDLREARAERDRYLSCMMQWKARAEKAEAMLNEKGLT